MLSLAAIAFVLSASGCARFSGIPPPYGAESAARSETATSPIKHVVIIVQENRSFDHYFSGYPGANSATSGMHGRKVIKLQRATFAAFGFGHSYGPAVADIDGGKMDDFELATPKPPAPPINANAYMDRSKIVPYWTMAEQYVLSDAMFSTELGPSFTAHQMIVAGTTEVSPTASIVDLPYGLPGDCLAPPGTEVTSLLTIHKKLLRNAGPAPCFTYPTIVDDLDPAGISWKYYYPAPSNLLWNAFQSIKKVALGPDKSNVVTAPTQVLLDAKGGHLAGVSWVIPDFLNSRGGLG